VENAKAAHPNGSAIDFENVVGGVDEAYVNRQVFGGEWLSLRPLTLVQFARLLNQMGELREGGFPGRQLQQVATLMAQVLVRRDEAARSNRQLAALAYAWQPHEGGGWHVVRDICEEGTFQDLLTLWRWPQGDIEGGQDAKTSQ
jgi:hypothetical protein